LGRKGRKDWAVDDLSNISPTAVRPVLLQANMGIASRIAAIDIFWTKRTFFEKIKFQAFFT
jgi:hypothetical protein